MPGSGSPQGPGQIPGGRGCGVPPGWPCCAAPRWASPKSERCPTLGPSPSASLAAPLSVPGYRWGLTPPPPTSTPGLHAQRCPGRGQEKAPGKRRAWRSLSACSGQPLRAADSQLDSGRSARANVTSPGGELSSQRGSGWWCSAAGWSQLPGSLAVGPGGPGASVCALVWGAVS